MSATRPLEYEKGTGADGMLVAKYRLLDSIKVLGGNYLTRGRKRRREEPTAEKGISNFFVLVGKNRVSRIKRKKRLDQGNTKKIPSKQGGENGGA